MDTISVTPVEPIHVISALDEPGVPLGILEAVRVSHQSFGMYESPWEDLGPYHFTRGVVLGGLYPLSLMRLKYRHPRGLFLAEGRLDVLLKREPIIVEGNIIGVYCEVPPNLEGEKLVKWAEHLVLGCWAGTLLQPWHGEDLLS